MVQVRTREDVNMCVHLQDYAQPRACAHPRWPHREHPGSDHKALKKVTCLDLSQGAALTKEMMMCSWSPDSMTDSLILGSTENLPSSMMSGLLRRTCSRQNQDHRERSHCTVRSGGPEARRLSSPPIQDGAKDRPPGLGCSPPHRALTIL